LNVDFSFVCWNFGYPVLVRPAGQLNDVAHVQLFVEPFQVGFFAERVPVRLLRRQFAEQVVLRLRVPKNVFHEGLEFFSVPLLLRVLAIAPNVLHQMDHFVLQHQLQTVQFCAAHDAARRVVVLFGGLRFKEVVHDGFGNLNRIIAALARAPPGRRGYVFGEAHLKRDRVRPEVGVELAVEKEAVVQVKQLTQVGRSQPAQICGVPVPVLDSLSAR